LALEGCEIVFRTRRTRLVEYVSVDNTRRWVRLREPARDRQDSKTDNAYDSETKEQQN
jgi:hypothetical protein